MTDGYRLRIDPILVNKFLRLPGGINEVAVKIVRDLGLQYAYDKRSQNLDIIGNNPEILSIAIETLRFWVEDDDFPNTGITCQVGYPNKCMVIWRYHGDYAKKLDHLFSEEIAKLKQISTVNVKAVPSKRNPEYVEVYCHFSVYNHVKDEVIRLSSELSRISQDDFFVPYSDYTKARRFARHKADDKSILYALKEYPERNRVRVWIFGREHIDAIRAKKEWMLHVGNISGDAELKETILTDNGVNSAHFYGHPSASTSRESSRREHKIHENPNPRSKQTIATTQGLTVSRKSASTAKSVKSSQRNGIKIPEFDNSNYPRPTNFVYPIDRQTIPEALTSDEMAFYSNPFNLNELNDITEENGTRSPENSIIGKSGWEEGPGTTFPSKFHTRNMPPNRIYVHHQVNDHNSSNTQTTNLAVKQVVHPETNLMPKERYRTRQSERVLTSVTDPKFAPSLKKNKNMRPGVKKQLQPKVMAFTRQKPVLQEKQTQNIRYHINVNGLDIYMYKHDLVKLNDMDAIVNAVNEEIRPGGHLSANVLEMAGPQVTDEIRVYQNIYGPLHVAENMVSSAGRIPVLGIIHVAAPIWENYLNISEEECARDLHRAIYSSLKTAEKHKYRKVGMPVISSEPFFGVPKDLVAEVYVKALVDYSMGMGPLYPVLEIHLVETDSEMLTYIKDAYEKWATDYNMVEMNQHFKSELPSQQELSERAQSAVTLKELPSHRSENMVTFTEQSYTAAGNQMWTFDVLKKLVVHVYTGSIVRLRDVETIVCGVNENLKGTLVKQMLNVGGMNYEVALRRARGDRHLIEGDVLVSEAGDLEVDLVLHSIVSQPIHKINEKNLVRLDRIYSQILQAANKLGIESLAMPLIGTGRLRQKFEIEQCSLQLIDNVIELCLSQERSLKIKELHLVNVNTVMTQSLTQALRTRAHTKLRVESDTHVPSRQDVLSLPDNPMNAPDLPLPILSARDDPADDIAEEFKQLANMQRRSKDRKRQFSDIEEMNKKIMRKQKERTVTLDDKVAEAEVMDNAKTEKDKKQNDITPKADKPNKHGTKDNGLSMANRNESVYLSKKNLLEHERKMEHTIESGNKKTARREDKLPAIQRSGKDKPHHHKHTKKENIDPNNKNNHEEKNDKLFKPSKTRKRRRLPPISGLVPQSSRAESYRSIYIRRQKLAAEMIKEQHVTIRRSQSTTNIQDSTNVPDELKNKTVEKLRAKPVKGGDDEDPVEKSNRDKIRRDSQNYFTRGTRDRYKPDKREIKADVLNSSRSVDVKGSTLGNYQRKGNLTERIGMDQGTVRKHVKERILWDREREDMYMKEVDAFTLAPNEEKQTKENITVDDDSTEEIDIAQKNNSFIQNNAARRDIRSGNSSTRHAEYKHPNEEINQFSNHNANENHFDTHVNEIEPQLPTSEPQEIRHADDVMQQEYAMQTDSAEFNRSLQRSSSLKDTRLTFPETSSQALENAKDVPENSEPDTQHRGSIATATTRSYATGSAKSKPLKLVISSELMPDKNKQKTDGKSTNKSGKNDISKQSDELQTHRSNNKPTITPRAEDVTIRDKLTVEIDVQDRERESSNVTREKAKIKRFWEVVGGKDVENETDIYGDPNQTDNEKILMTKVTKERKMSAKSKHSEGTSVASQKIGKYNVTVEVA